MSSEVERRFLVDGRLWQPRRAGVVFKQAYLSSVKERVVRVRIWDGRALLTIRGLPRNVVRSEFSYEIPLDDAERVLQLCERPVIEKTRYSERHGDHDWVIDVFHGDNAGLAVARIELATEREGFFHPAWLGAEVTGDPRYFNINLARHPYGSWTPAPGTDSRHAAPVAAGRILPFA